jgi:hypothetical protein
MAGLQLIEAHLEEQLGVRWGKLQRRLEGCYGLCSLAEIFQKCALKLQRWLEVWVLCEQVPSES